MIHRKRGPFLLIGVAISILFLWLAARGTDPTTVGQALVRANWWLAPPFLAMLFISYWMKALRWSILLRPLRQTTTGWEAFPAVMVGFAANIILPAQLGELVRMYVISRQLGLRNTPVLATILLERVFDFLTILLFLTAVLSLGTAVPANLVKAGYAMGATSVIVLVFAGLYLTWTEVLVKIFRKVTSILPSSMHTALIEQLEIGAAGLQSIKNPRLLLIIAITSIAQWGSLAVCIHLAIVALAVAIPPSASVLVMVLMIAALTLPSSPGYFGPVQLAFTLGLKPFVVNTSDALAASIFYHILAYTTVAISGLYLVRRMGYTLGQIQRQAESTDETKDSQGVAAKAKVPQGSSRTRRGVSED